MRACNGSAVCWLKKLCSVSRLRPASEITSAPMSGEKLFQARAKLRAPESSSHEELEEALEQIAASLMADISVDES